MFRAFSVRAFKREGNERIGAYDEWCVPSPCRPPHIETFGSSLVGGSHEMSLSFWCKLFGLDRSELSFPATLAGPTQLKPTCDCGK